MGIQKGVINRKKPQKVEKHCHNTISHLVVALKNFKISNFLCIEFFDFCRQRDERRKQEELLHKVHKSKADCYRTMTTFK